MNNAKIIQEISFDYFLCYLALSSSQNEAYDFYLFSPSKSRLSTNYNYYLGTNNLVDSNHNKIRK